MDVVAGEDAVVATDDDALVWWREEQKRKKITVFYTSYPGCLVSFSTAKHEHRAHGSRSRHHHYNTLLENYSQTASVVHHHVRLHQPHSTCIKM